MGWKGTTRSIVATSRRISREMERAEKQRRKEEAIAYAQDTEEQYQLLLDHLTSVHRVDFKREPWSALAAQQIPDAPPRKNDHEHAAQAKLEGFKPSFFHKVLGLEKDIRKKLAIEVEEARAEDDIAHKNAQSDWENKRGQIERAKKISDGDVSACLDAFNANADLGELPFAEQLNIIAFDDGEWKIKVEAMSEEAFPEKRYRALKSGKISETNLPKGEYYDLQLKNVCGGALRAAVEFFRWVPAKRVYVDVAREMLNPATGYMEDMVILSVEFVAETLARINLKRVEADRALENFNHNLKFMKTKGFQPVTSLYVEEND